jgi:UDP-N-acetylmuramyl tripeptide synthase
MNIRLFLTILISKLIIKACRLLRRGGTTLAGRIALNLYPDILKLVANNLRVIMITGTNGKTTTARIMEQILNENGIEYISNKSGANLASGITTTFMEAVNLKGSCTVSTALLEIDEAAFKQVVNFIEPDILVVTNFFRDQLDRFGELSNTLKGVLEGIRKTQKTTLILNSDDSMSVSLHKDTGQKTLFYGINKDSYKSTGITAGLDAQFCIYCKTKYKYSYRVYGHLGGFKCPSCGYERIIPQVTCINVEEMTSSHSIIKLGIDFPKASIEPEAGSILEPAYENSDNLMIFDVKINLPGIYNVYNALAAVSCALAMKLPIESIIKALSSFKGGFGRMETVKFEDKRINIILVKNPAGFNQVLEFLLALDKNLLIAFAIDDKPADGTDVSWLWDVDFENLSGLNDETGIFYISGRRAEDMALRLKYAGIDTRSIRIIKDYNELIKSAIMRMSKDEDGDFYILPTYTAMLDIRKVLRKTYKIKEF